MPPATTTLSYTLATIDDAVRLFWHTVQGVHTIAFSGEMGAGKTTFIHHLCLHLGVEDAVSSPTFALINEYHFNTNTGETIIYHLDWYRLKNPEEAVHAGMEDCITQAQLGKAYCLIEWPEKALALLKRPYVWASIEAPDELTRQMTLTVN